MTAAADVGALVADRMFRAILAVVADVVVVSSAEAAAGLLAAIALTAAVAVATVDATTASMTAATVAFNAASEDIILHWRLVMRETKKVECLTIRKPICWNNCRAIGQRLDKNDASIFDD